MNKELENIIKKAKLGHRGSQKELYEIHRTQWFMVCLRYARNKDEAKDLLQEGILQLIKDLRQFDNNKGSFSAWSNRVFAHAAIHYLKKFKNFEFYQDINEPYKHQIENTITEGRINEKMLTEVLQKLPDGYRLIFNLYVLEGYSHNEISKILNIAVGTSKSQLHKSKRMIRKWLELAFKKIK